MSEPTFTITATRLNELVELGVARVQAAKAATPTTTMVNCNVKIDNHYGDEYEEDTSPINTTQESARSVSQSANRVEQINVREDIVSLMVLVEKTMQEYERRNPTGFTHDPIAAREELVDRFEELQLKLKGDTSLELVGKAYIWMLIQLVLSASLSEVFSG